MNKLNLWTAAALLVLSAGAAFAQPEGRRDPQPPDAARETPADPAEAHKMLERRIDELSKRQERLREALKKLEAGLPVRDALRGVDLRGEGDMPAMPAMPPGEMRPGRRTEGPEERGARPDRGPERSADRMNQDRPGQERGDRAERRHDGEAPDLRPDSRRGPERPERNPTPPTAEERARAREFLHEHLPGVAAKIEAHDNEHPEQADRNFARMMPRLLEAQSTMRRDPALFKLRLKEIEGQVAVVEAIRERRAAIEAKDDARTEHATAALRAALGVQLDTRMDLQMHEIESLSQRVEEMKSDVDRKRAGREQAIDSMLNRMKSWGQRDADSNGKPDGKPEGKPQGKPRDGDRKDGNRPPPPR